MEKQLFDWVDWDQSDTTAFMFYDVTLRLPIGKFPAGTKFNSAYIDYENAKLEFFNDGETPEFTGSLSITVN